MIIKLLDKRSSKIVNNITRRADLVSDPSPIPPDVFAYPVDYKFPINHRL